MLSIIYGKISVCGGGGVSQNVVDNLSSTHGEIS